MSREGNSMSHAEENRELLPQRLRERGDFLRERSRVKDAELMYDAATEIEDLRRRFLTLTQITELNQTAFPPAR